MSLYDEKVYDFLTQLDNWQIAREVSDKMGYVKERLIKEFWDDVINDIKDKINLDEWNLYEEIGVVGIEHKAWKKLFSVESGNINSDTWIGVWCDQESKAITESYNDLADRFKISEKRFTRKDSVSYPAWFYTGDNFDQLMTLDKILPSCKEHWVEKYSSLIISLSDKVKPVIDAFLSGKS